MAEDSNGFYCQWDNIIFFKVEDKLFCVPRWEFVQSSEVFADMFLLPSGPATLSASEGQDRDHPIVLEGYKKDEFACLLKVMYPTAGSLISGTNVEFHLKKEEWVSVLKLSTIWNMTKIRHYAIHRLSTDVALSPIEKILLARAHRVSAWLDEAVTSLASCSPMPTLEDLATLGWETVARIFWIRDNLNPPRNASAQNRLRFRRDAIKCTSSNCSSSLIIIGSYSCGHISSGDAELTFSGPTSPLPGTNDHLVRVRQIECAICRRDPFISIRSIACSCSSIYNIPSNPYIRATVYDPSPLMIEKMFGEEIKDFDC